ncbi:MAG TPA: XRE family transcriptional regulator [Devosia sp.]|nr:XRE family transcriptional regulator [Devosia sp.]
MAAQGGGVVISFMDRAGARTAERVARRLGVRIDAPSTQADAGTGEAAAGASAPGLSERGTSAKAELRLREMFDIIGRISFRTGGPWQAMVWYRGHRIPAFGGRTAEALVKEGKAFAVHDYIDGLAVDGLA